MRKLLVTGATGFTGRHVVQLLLERYGEIACFVRSSSDRSRVNHDGVSFVEGDLDDPASLEAALRGKDILISIASLVGNDNWGTRAAGIVRTCNATGVKRAIFVSSTSIFTTMTVPAKSAKLVAEKAVQSSGLDYTLLRPTMIYGTASDRNMIRLIRFLRHSPIMFVPGNGKFRQQPIHVEDLARALVDCLESEVTFGQAYNLSGAEPIAFNELVDETCRALGIRRVKVHVPLHPALWVARLLRRLQDRPWIKEEQILRLNEDKCFDHSAASRDFGFAPRSFAAGIRQEVTHGFEFVR
jgi:uncharacterized protein YbjT (DUF2867 family)